MYKKFVGMAKASTIAAGWRERGAAGVAGLEVWACDYQMRLNGTPFNTR